MNALDIGPLIPWVVALATILSFGTAIWNLFNSGTRINATRITSLEDRVEMTERAVQRHTDQITQLPDHEVSHRLELSLAKLHGDFKILEERLRPVAAIAERMQELMIAESRK